MHTSRTAPRLRLLALLVAMALVPSVLAGAATQDDLEATRERIERTIEELESVDAEAARTEEQVAAAEERVAELEAALNELLLQLEAQQQAVDAARAEAETAAAERDRIEQVLGDRARRAFMGGTPDPLLMLGGEGGIDDVAGAFDSLALLGALTAREEASVETLDVARIQADASAERLDAEVAQLEEVRAAREEVLVEAERVLTARADALADLEAQADRLMAQQESLEAEEAEIQQLIKQQQEAARRAEEERRRAAEAAAAEQSSSSGSSSEPAPAPPPPSTSGCYAWPANGPVTSEYGPRWGRMHRGLDIDGNTGDPLYAAQSGTVSYTGYYSGYGNLTLISHSDGVTTAYAHQSSFGVSTGQTVGRGEFIGRMGATGNVTGSHLHFETRTSSGAVNPRRYLC